MKYANHSYDQLREVTNLNQKLVASGKLGSGELKVILREQKKIRRELEIRQKKIK